MVRVVGRRQRQIKDDRMAPVSGGTHLYPRASSRSATSERSTPGISPELLIQFGKEMSLRCTWGSSGMVPTDSFNPSRRRIRWPLDQEIRMVLLETDVTSRGKVSVTRVPEVESGSLSPAAAAMMAGISL